MINGEMGQSSHHASEQIEEQVFNVAQQVLDVIPEHPQEHHISGEVQNPPCMNMDEKMVTHVGSDVSMQRVTPCSVTMVE